MTAATSDTRQEMERTLAQVVSREPAVSELWASADHEGLHFWLVTTPLDAETERGLYELADALDERFPSVAFHLHVLNPRYYTGSARDAVPAGAGEIPLRAA